MAYPRALYLGCLIGMTSMQIAQAQVVITGDVGVEFGRSTILSTDDADQEFGQLTYGVNGSIMASLASGWSGALDFNMMGRDIGSNDFDEFAPSGAGSLGLHVGRDFGGNYVGAFYGMNRFQGDDASSPNGFLTGNLYGIEGEFALGSSTTMFAQYGTAEMIGDGTDTAFEGNFYRLGVSTRVNEKFTISLETEMGRSSERFEDDGDWGEYRTVSLSGEYKFAPRLIGTLTVSQMDIAANTEDLGRDNSVSIGLSIPLGADHRKSNLTTSYNPGLAAAWAETLD